MTLTSFQRVAMAAALFTSLQLVTGCSGMTTRDKDTVIGAAVGGAVVGGVIGNQIGKDRQ